MPSCALDGMHIAQETPACMPTERIAQENPALALTELIVSETPVRALTRGTLWPVHPKQ